MDTGLNLKKITNLSFYGPGYEIYNKNDNFDDILAKFQIKFDCIFLGHSWLSDASGKYDIPNSINFAQIKLPKFIFLNKEYVNLDYKLNYIIKNKFNACFTHHNNQNLYIKKTKIKFFFIPFAFNSQRLKKRKYKKNIDIFFSGVLRNQNKNSNQSSFRMNVMSVIYKKCFNLKLYKKKIFMKYKVFWNSVPILFIEKIISKYLNQYKYLSDKQYDDNLQKSKLIINSLSPIGLVSPRYYETLAVRGIIFSEKSSLIEDLIPSKYIVYAENNVNEITKKLKDILENYESYDHYLDEAQNYVFDNHTWDHRAKQVLVEIRNCL